MAFAFVFVFCVFVDDKLREKLKHEDLNPIYEYQAIPEYDANNQFNYLFTISNVSHLKISQIPKQFPNLFKKPIAGYKSF